MCFIIVFFLNLTFGIPREDHFSLEYLDSKISAPCHEKIYHTSTIAAPQNIPKKALQLNTTCLAHHHFHFCEMLNLNTSLKIQAALEFFKSTHKYNTTHIISTLLIFDFLRPPITT